MNDFRVGDLARCSVDDESLWHAPGPVPEKETRFGHIDAGDVVIILSEILPVWHRDWSGDLKKSDYLFEVRVMTRLGPAWVLTGALEELIACESDWF